MWGGGERERMVSWVDRIDLVDQTAESSEHSFDTSINHEGKFKLFRYALTANVPVNFFRQLPLSF